MENCDRVIYPMDRPIRANAEPAEELHTVLNPEAELAKELQQALASQHTVTNATTSLLEVIAHNASQAIAISDAAGLIQYLSSNSGQVLGCSPAKLINCLQTDVIDFGDRYVLQTAWASLLQRHGNHLVIEARLLQSDGSWRYLETSISNQFHNLQIGGMLINWRDLTTLKQAQQEVNRLEVNLASIQRGGKIGTWTYNPGNGKLTWSKETFQMFGLPEDTAEPSYEQLLTYIHPDDRRHFEASVRRVLQKGKCYGLDYRIMRADGSVGYVHARGHTVLSATQQVESVFGTVLDITRHKQIEEALRESQRQFVNLIDTLPGIVFSRAPSADYGMCYLSQGCFELTGYRNDQLVLHGTPSYNAIIHPQDMPRLQEELQQAIAVQRDYGVEYRIVMPTGEERWFWEKGKVVRTANDEVMGLEGFITDISDRKQMEAVLEEFSNVDGLTQVSNRRRFDAYLEQEWRRLTRDQLPISLILCDVDFFKAYNDTYGHQAGDECLRQVAECLEASIKRPADLVARYGGEEFAVILPNTDGHGAMQVAEVIRDRVRQRQIPHRQSAISEHITLSFGIASVIPQVNISSAILVATADRSLYRAKAEGRDLILYEGITL